MKAIPQNRKCSSQNTNTCNSSHTCFYNNMNKSCSTRSHTWVPHPDIPNPLVDRPFLSISTDPTLPFPLYTSIATLLSSPPLFFFSHSPNPLLTSKDPPSHTPLILPSSRHSTPQQLLPSLFLSSTFLHFSSHSPLLTRHFTPHLGGFCSLDFTPLHQILYSTSLHSTPLFSSEDITTTPNSTLLYPTPLCSTWRHSTPLYSTPNSTFLHSTPPNSTLLHSTNPTPNCFTELHSTPLYST